jgi:ATP-dependent 26S proteasome regulatory subunit
LNNKDDKGIVLLHGLPGTGKTTYLRYLIGKLKKRVLFLSNNLAGSLVDPEFIDLLISNPNSIVIVEDAENIMMDRRTNANSTVSSLLNISDGLLADFLNIQLVCTFNSPLVMVDPALMRKGRLIARYDFGKLSIEKAQKLSDHLGFDKKITKPMTLAEISNPNDKEETKIEVIGFRRHNEIMN